METKNILSVKEVAEYLGLNYFTVVRYAKTGKLPAVKTGHKWLFHRETLEDFLKDKAKKNIITNNDNH